MGERRKSRELLLQFLFQRELNFEENTEILWRFFWDAFGKEMDSEMWIKNYFMGIDRHRIELDKLIEAHSTHWRLSRMSVVDRNILRIAVYEFCYSQETTPGEIVLNEAIELAKRFGDENSGAFVNGVLDKIWKENIGSHAA